ncbi:hypothetical protein NA56DRAFT_645209 [Hyaloscypha hepaticicola]|uniref:Uncharacterized protein n=1 Tax=Hyaloscypha hepaticicola TaxID=2082293 RepID=A0A2J6Q6W4_9HELO|nr:hypothetical protein NA56DRAFT_645209 [Hyaloscypha hepaticicola]
MSSCTLSWHEKNSRERESNSTPECPSCRASSSLIDPGFLALIGRLIKESAAFATLIASAILIDIYGPSHGRALTLSSLDEEGNDLSRDTEPALSVYCRKLAKLGRRVVEEYSVLAKIATRIASLADTLHLPQLLEDPSPQLFFAACLAFAFAVAALQHLHKKDLYMNRILVSGLILGCAAAYQSTNSVMELKSYLAWSAIIALLLNVLVHLALRLWQGPQRNNNGLETEVQLHDKSCERKEGQDDGFYSQGLRHPDIHEVRGN